MTVDDVITANLEAARSVRDFIDRAVLEPALRQQWNAICDEHSEVLFEMDDDGGGSLHVALFLDCLGVE